MRLRRDQRRDLREHSTSQALTEDGETPPFVVTRLQPSTAQLSLEHPVLLAQEFDHVPLFPFEQINSGIESRSGKQREPYRPRTTRKGAAGHSSQSSTDPGVGAVVSR